MFTNIDKWEDSMMRWQPVIIGLVLGWLIHAHAKDVARALGASPKIQKEASNIAILILFAILIVDILI